MMKPPQQIAFGCMHRCARLMACGHHAGRTVVARSAHVQSSNVHLLPSNGAAARTGGGRLVVARTRAGETGRLYSTNHAATKEMEEKVDALFARVKHRIPQKRASALMSDLRKEAEVTPPLEIPDIRSGDAVEVKMYDSKTIKTYNVLRGVCVRRVNKGSDTSVLLRDIMYDIDVEHFIPLYSPLIKSIEILEKGFIYQGKKRGKRVRQSRIYYLKGLHDKFSRVTGSRF